MKIYTKIILDKNNNILEENFYEYSGPSRFLWNTLQLCQFKGFQTNGKKS